LSIRVGIGYDVHKLTEGRKLILGGVEIPYEKGLLGHSDADVLVHAIMDALLGAMSLGDIGKHFPDTDNKYLNISSLVLLSEVRDTLLDNGYHIMNIDTVVVMQKPKIACYIEEMKKNISCTLCISIDDINIKATTEEGLGFTGSSEGVSCKAICLLEKRK